MPRARPRPEPEPCDCLECREPAGAAPSQGAADAAARQAPPPKCLVLFADGVLPALEAADRAAGQHGAPLLPHLDGLVREGSLGTLAVREAATAASQAEGGAEQLAELAQLLGVQAAALQGSGTATACEAAVESLAARYQDIAVDFCSNCGPARELAARAGCREVSELAAAGPRGGPGPDLSLPAPGGVAAHVGASLGLQAWLEEAAARSGGAGGAGGAPAPSPAAPAPVADAANDAGDAGDVLVVHVSLAAATASGAALHSGAEPAPPGASACGSQLRGMDAADGIRGRLELAGGAGAGGGQLWQEEGCPPDAAPLEWLDAVGLLLVLLVGSAGRPALALPAPGGGVLGKLGVRDAGAWAGVRRPRQSYEVAGGAAVATLPRSGLLVAQRLTGVVRRDGAARLSAAEAAARGGGGCILLERVLPELAFKLGRAPKYGA